MTDGGSGSLHSAAWPDMFDSLQTAYAELNEAQFELEHRIAEVDETRELFERVVDSMSEALVLTDRTGRIMRINRAAADLLGVTAAEVTGRPLADVWPAQDIPTTPWELTDRVPTGALSDVDAVFPGEEGEVRHASVSCGLLRDKFGAISGLLLVARDVTAQMRRADAERFLSEASALLVRSLNAQKTLRDLARMCVPRLADWCAIVVESRSGGRRVIAAHADPSLDRDLSALAQDTLGDGRWSRALTDTLATGTIRVEEGPPFTSPADAAGLNARFGGDCTAAVPMVARGRVLGAIGLVWSGRPPGLRSDAVELAEEMAQRAALAIDNAQLHEAERRSRRSAQTVAERLRRVQDVTDAALTHLDLDGLVASLLERIAAGLHIDVAAVFLLDEDRAVLVPLAVHGLAEETREEIPLGQGYAGRIAAEGRAMAVEDVDLENVALSALRRHGIRSLAGVPLLLERRLTGVLVVSSRARRSFSSADMTLLRLVGDRVALAIENARLYERERSIAETLQRSLLPHKVADVPGLEVAARYLPGGAGVDVGGDWYDVIELPDGRAGVAVGDVGGRGIPAATTMGQLRTALRTYAFEGFSPARALERLNLLSSDTEHLFATAVYLLIDPVTRHMRYASAGHLPPLVLYPDGRAAWLEGGRWLPLGVRPPTIPAVEDEETLPPGATVLLYTDGLVERRTIGIDHGLERLHAAIRRAPSNLEGLLDSVLGDLLSDEDAGGDDVAVLALRLCPAADCDLSVDFPAEPSRLREVRERLRDWLLACGLPADVRHDLVLAAGELCANAVEHPNRRRSETVQLSASLATDGWLTLTVRDRGEWRPPRSTPNRGFGLQIARRVVDAFDLRPGPEGTTVTLRRRVHGGARR